MNSLQMLHPQSNPQTDYENAIGYLQPYDDAGLQSMGMYENNLSRLLMHPVGLENRIMSTYHMSPYARYQTNTLNQMSNNQAALAGNLGTPDQQQALMNQEQGIVSKDQQDYLRNAMMPYQWGLQGEQYLTGLGAKSAAGMAAQKDLEAIMAMKQAGMGLGALGGLIGAGTQLGTAALLGRK